MNPIFQKSCLNLMRLGPNYQNGLDGLLHPKPYEWKDYMKFLHWLFYLSSLPWIKKTINRNCVLPKFYQKSYASDFGRVFVCYPILIHWVMRMKVYWFDFRFFIWWRRKILE